MAEETILTGDDLMLGPPSPVVPPEVASHVLDGLETCSTALRRLFLCKLIHLSLVWSKQNDCFCSLFASVLGRMPFFRVAVTQRGIFMNLIQLKQPSGIAHLAGIQFTYGLWTMYWNWLQLGDHKMELHIDTSTYYQMNLKGCSFLCRSTCERC